ncbi:DUF3221 domain-containing protein [Paenibacillus sp. HJL G12]|uniref:DUF3221 domain-containing protein n=1 Tax=Paenibacillus dendrobii TaxID=2691084 RepID=A0A7X3IM53_9BACL|nr:DUF3221 domain-containing protein [Paenibacillus dendrobii]MWV46063.1 DUF3221 domain-containing protein [Paenibacillus dendrobii]
MRKHWIFAVILLLITGCSAAKVAEPEGRWDHKHGYVVAKENGRVLVVRKQAAPETPLNDILAEAQPDAIWLSVGKGDYDAVSVGDEVGIRIANGAIDESYPAQAGADIDIK